MSVLRTDPRRFVTFFLCLFTSVENILHKRFYNVSYIPQSFLSKTVSALRNHVQSKLHNYTGLNLICYRNKGLLQKYANLIAFIKQVALVT